MPTIHVRLPYAMLHKHPEFMATHKPNLEIFISSDDLDEATPSEIASDINRTLDYNPSISIHAPFMDLAPGAIDSFVRQGTQRRFKQAIDVAEGVSARAIVFHSGYGKWKYDHKVEPWLENSLKFWPDIIKKASEAGVMVAIENIFEEEPGTLKMLMDGLNTKEAGICFDVGHFNLFTKFSLKDWIDALGQYIVELHLHDNLGNVDSHMPPGDGNIDFDSLFSLVGSERDILWTIEGKSEADTLTSLERFRQYL